MHGAQAFRVEPPEPPKQRRRSLDLFDQAAADLAARVKAAAEEEARRRQRPEPRRVSAWQAAGPAPSAPPAASGSSLRV